MNPPTPLTHKTALPSLLLCISHLLTGVGLDTNASDIRQTAEALKKLLSTPPCYRLISCSISDCDGRKTKHLLAACCNRDFVYGHTASNVQDFMPPISSTNFPRATLYLGRTGTTRWQIAGFNLTESYDPNLSAPDPYAEGSDHREPDVAEILTFGGYLFKPGSFVWEDDAFTAEIDPIAIKGQSNADQILNKDTRLGAKMRRGTLSLISEKKLVLFGLGFGRAELTFAANSGFPDGWPASVRRLGVLERTNECFTMIVDHKVIPGTPKSVGYVTNPANLITPDVRVRKLYTNSVQVLAEPANDLVTSLVARDINTQYGKRRRQSRLLYFGIGFVVLTGLVLLARHGFGRT